MPKASFLNMEEEEVPPTIYVDLSSLELSANESPISPPNDTIYIAPGYIDLDPVTNVRMGEESLADLAEFAARLDVEGGGQPAAIIVRPSDTPGRYKIVAGRRRLAAMQLLGKGILAHVRTDLDDQAARRLAFEENFRRKQFSPVELARLFIEARGEKYQANWSERVAKRFGVSRATVTETIKMHEGLAGTPDLLDRVHRGELTGDAAILLSKQAAESSELFQQAQAVAIDEAAKRAAKGKKGDGRGKEDRERQEEAAEGVADSGQGKKQPSTPVQVKKKHVKAAAKAAGSKGAATGPLNRAEIVDGLLRLVNPSFPAVMNAFLNCAMTDWQKGTADHDVLKNHWLQIACQMDDSTPGCGSSGDPVVQRMSEAGLAEMFQIPEKDRKRYVEGKWKKTVTKKAVAKKTTKKAASKPASKKTAKKSTVKSAKKPRK